MNNQLMSNGIEKALIDGDLSALSVEQRLEYYKSVCESLGLNPMTKPFAYIKLNGKLVLYALNDCTEQLRALRGVSVTKLERERIDDVYAVTAYAALGERTDSSIGAVTIANLRGDALANALMKAETKAKRRVTLSICGLGMLDETEIETIPSAQRVETLVIPERVPQEPIQNVTWAELGSASQPEAVAAPVPKMELKAGGVPIPSHQQKGNGENGNKAGRAALRTTKLPEVLAWLKAERFVEADATLAAEQYHILAIAHKAGFESVTDANLPQLLIALSKHFNDKLAAPIEAEFETAAA